MKEVFNRSEDPELMSEQMYEDESALISRRQFTQILGAGLLLTVSLPLIGAERGGGGRGGGGGRSVAARVHIGVDGRITVMTGKVEGGQGARAELTQSAAEELRVSPEKINLIMGDTSLVPDDGITAGSRTTPSTVPAVRQGAASARELLIKLACEKLNVERAAVELREGVIIHTASGKKIPYGELAQDAQWEKLKEQPVDQNVTLTPVKEWRVMGTSYPRPNRRALVTGEHKFPSDIILPGMLYGKVLRPPTIGARLVSVDLEPARQMKDVVVVREGDFVGVAAPTTFQAQKALDAIAATAKWESVEQPSSRDVYDYLRKRAREEAKNPFEAEAAQSAKTLSQTYRTAYIQHAPMETRCAVAEWKDGSVTVWGSTQNPFGWRSEIARALNLSSGQVRVIVPDFGGGFGGKHTAEAGIGAARIARAANKPVRVKWTREEEFTWAYFRPAAVIEIQAGIDASGKITFWHFVNYNSGGAAVDTPYNVPKNRSRFVPSSSPYRQGSYRALAATANNFARECFMDELAELANSDPLSFRLAHIENPRLRAVLEEAARRFGWAEAIKQKKEGTGYGLACGTEKGSYVAACVEIAIENEQIVVKRVTQVFECGKIINPLNLMAQVQGCIIMGLGAALREEMRFDSTGRVVNPKFSLYPVPKMSDVPVLDIHLLDRPDLPSVGGGETPIIAIAPAIANAVFYATGKRARQMPIRI